MKTSANLSYLLYMASVTMAGPITKRATSTYDGGLTANDVTDGVCAPLTLIHARGSTELGNMGETVGPALAKELISLLGSGHVAVQGVDYDASILSNVSLGSDGGPTMASLAKKALAQCPSTKIALSGYSQGGLVIHYAVANAGLSASDVAAVVIYGDPLDGASVGSLPISKLKEYCAAGDGVCELHGFEITAAHLSYTLGSDITGGAQFIVDTSGVGSSSTTSVSGTASIAAATGSASSILGSLGI